jgi:hypothetical protein
LASAPRGQVEIEISYPALHAQTGKSDNTGRSTGPNPTQRVTSTTSIRFGPSVLLSRSHGLAVMPGWFNPFVVRDHEY